MEIKDRIYAINLDDYKSIRTHWIVIFIKNHLATYFDSFKVEYLPKEIKKFIANKNISTNIYRIQANNSIIYRYSCIGFIDFMLKTCVCFFYQIFILSPNHNPSKSMKNVFYFI